MSIYDDSNSHHTDHRERSLFREGIPHLEFIDQYWPLTPNARIVRT
jgi:hypothetical protein